jgi:hypothetical protein
MALRQHAAEPRASLVAARRLRARRNLRRLALLGAAAVAVGALRARAAR